MEGVSTYMKSGEMRISGFRLSMAGLLGLVMVWGCGQPQRQEFKPVKKKDGKGFDLGDAEGRPVKQVELKASCQDHSPASYVIVL